jgi:hypothetical protein
MGRVDTHPHVRIGNVIPAFLCADHICWLFYIDTNISFAYVQGDEGDLFRFDYVYILSFKICDFVVLF